MPSLGETAAAVRVRPVIDDEALLLGALHLRALRRRGAPAPAVRPGAPSHVQAFARSWQHRSADLPAWVGEADGEHVGMAVCRAPLLPRVGSGVPALVLVEALVKDGSRAEAVILALVRGVVAWAGREGYPAVDVAADVRLPTAVLDAARADVLAHRRVSLPTRP